MNKYIKSLLLSLLIHSLLVAAVLYAYEKRDKLLSNDKEPKKIVLHLASLQTESKKADIVKKNPSQPHKKRVLKKKRPHLKKIPKIKKIEKRRKIKKQESVKPVEKKQQTQKRVVHATVKKSKTGALKKRVVTKESQKQKYIDLHLHEIVTLLQNNLYYPRRARERGIEGEVVVSFTLQKSGEVTGLVVLSSTKDILSRAAIKTLKDLSGKFPKPAEKIKLKLPIKYILN